MKKLFIHIGPPKTATTSLQVYLERARLSNVAFLGKFQRDFEVKREIGITKVISRVIRYLKGNGGLELLNSIQTSIDLFFETSDVIIISEEKFIFHENWKEKLFKLADLFRKYDPVIIYGFRDSQHAVPSYYCESYNYLEEMYLKNYEAFVNSEWVEIYNLKIVDEVLKEVGFNKLHIYEFNEFIKGKLSLNNIFGENNPQSEWNCFVVPEVINKKSISVGEQRTSMHKFEVVLNRYKRIPSKLKLGIDRSNNFILKLLNKIFIRLLQKKIILSIPYLPVLESRNNENLNFISECSAN